MNQHFGIYLPTLSCNAMCRPGKAAQGLVLGEGLKGDQGTQGNPGVGATNSFEKRKLQLTGVMPNGRGGGGYWKLFEII